MVEWVLQGSCKGLAGSIGLNPFLGYLGAVRGRKGIERAPEGLGIDFMMELG